MINDKKATVKQIAKLEELRNELTITTQKSDEKIAAATHIGQILNDIDRTSSFSTSVSMEILRFKGERNMYPLQTLIATVSQAIQYYKELD